MIKISRNAKYSLDHVNEGNRLQIRNLDHLVPLCLQVAVEHSVKHGTTERQQTCGHRWSPSFRRPEKSHRSELWSSPKNWFSSADRTASMKVAHPFGFGLLLKVERRPGLIEFCWFIVGLTIGLACWTVTKRQRKEIFGRNVNNVPRWTF